MSGGIGIGIEIGFGDRAGAGNARIKVYTVAYYEALWWRGSVAAWQRGGMVARWRGGAVACWHLGRLGHSEAFLRRLGDERGLSTPLRVARHRLGLEQHATLLHGQVEELLHLCVRENKGATKRSVRWGICEWM